MNQRRPRRVDRSRRARPAIALLLVGLVAVGPAACGSSDDDPAGSGAEVTSTTVGGPVNAAGDLDRCREVAAANEAVEAWPVGTALTSAPKDDLVTCLWRWSSPTGTASALTVVVGSPEDLQADLAATGDPELALDLSKPTKVTWLHPEPTAGSQFTVQFDGYGVGDDLAVAIAGSGDDSLDRDEVAEVFDAAL